MLKDWSFWLSVITAGAAIFALFQSAKQTKLSNKHHLFDKRVENYLIAMGLMELYQSNQHLLKHDEDEPIFSIDVEFVWLTNNAYMERIASVMDAPLKDPHHKEFLAKLEDLKNVSTKIKLLFSGKSSTVLSDFVLSYQALIFTMYQYQIVIKKMEELDRGRKHSLKEAQNKIGEAKHRERLQKALIKIAEANRSLQNKNVIKQIEQQIKLN